jgi:hypothetical protein
VCQRADGDEVGAGLRKLRDALQRHATRNFDLRPARDASNGLANLFE